MELVILLNFTDHHLVIFQSNQKIHYGNHPKLPSTHLVSVDLTNY